MRDRLIELIKQSEQQETLDFLASDLDGQIDMSGGTKTSCSLEYLVNFLLENGVICPPCKVGDVVYVVCRSHFSKNASIREQKATHLKYINGYWYIDTDTHFDKEYGLSVFTNYEEAEKALRGEGE